MPQKRKNQLIEMALVIPEDIDKFTIEYDVAVDKKDFVNSIGDFIALRNSNIALFTKMTKSLKLTDDDENDCCLHMLLHHSNQNNVNHQHDTD